MMKKIVAVFLLILLLVTCCSCSNSKLITIENAILLQDDESELNDFFVFFRFENNNENRTVSFTELNTGNGNYYDAESKSQYYNNTYTYMVRTMNLIGYQDIEDVGDIMGGSEPKNLVAHFRINPNDVTASKSFVFDFCDESKKFKTSDIQIINSIDEVTTCFSNDDLKNSAAFLWRIDKCLQMTEDLYEGLGRKMTYYYPENFSEEEQQEYANLYEMLFSESADCLPLLEYPLDDGTYEPSPVKHTLDMEKIYKDFPEVKEHMEEIKKMCASIAEALKVKETFGEKDYGSYLSRSKAIANELRGKCYDVIIDLGIDDIID